jgi:hypothetical protein
MNVIFLKNPWRTYCKENMHYSKIECKVIVSKGSHTFSLFSALYFHLFITALA